MAAAGGGATAVAEKAVTSAVSLLLRVLNIGNAVLLAAACVFIFMKASQEGVKLSVTQTFLSVYIGVFSVLLFAFESRVKWTEAIIRRNFGFMFSYMGRALFLIFLSAVCFGMLNSDQASTPWYSWAAGAGAGTLINSFINCVVICSHPGFAELSKQAEQDSALAEAGGAGADPSKMSTEQLAAYLQAHPEVAKAAVAAAVGGGVPAQAPAEAAFTGGAGTGASGSGGAPVQEWGAVAVAASSKPEKSSGGGLFGFGKKNKDKGGNGGGGAGGEGGAYVPPAAPAAAAAAPSDVAVSLSTAAPVHGHDGGSNPFGGGGGFIGAVAAAPAPAAAASAPFGAPAAVAAPRAAAAPAAHHEDVEDNPFAS